MRRHFGADDVPRLCDGVGPRVLHRDPRGIHAYRSRGRLYLGGGVAAVQQRDGNRSVCHRLRPGLVGPCATDPHRLLAERVLIDREHVAVGQAGQGCGTELARVARDDERRRRHRPERHLGAELLIGHPELRAQVVGVVPVPGSRRFRMPCVRIEIAQHVAVLHHPHEAGVGVRAPRFRDLRGVAPRGRGLLRVGIVAPVRRCHRIAQVEDDRPVAAVVSQRGGEFGVDRLRIEVRRDAAEEVDFDGVESPRGEGVGIGLVMTVAAEPATAGDVRAGIRVDPGFQPLGVDGSGERTHAARESGRITLQCAVGAARHGRLPAAVEPDDVVALLRQPARDQEVGDVQDLGAGVVASQAVVGVPALVRRRAQARLSDRCSWCDGCGLLRRRCCRRGLRSQSDRSDHEHRCQRGAHSCSQSHSLLQTSSSSMRRVALSSPCKRDLSGFGMQRPAQ